MPTAPLTQDFQWDDLPTELKDKISKQVNTNRIARLRMERSLLFRYAEAPTPDGAAVFGHLRQLLMAWGYVNGPPVGYHNGPLVDAMLLQIFDRNFRLCPQDDDDVNVTAAEWAQVVLRIVSV